jgi:tetratricopeptide (TPR) repeat protein
VRAEHAAYFGDLMDKIRPLFFGKKERQAVEAVEAEIENLRVAWRWALDHQHWQSLSQQLHSIMLYLQSRSMIQEALARFDELSKVLEAAGMKNSKLYWRTRIRFNWLSGRLGAYERSLKESSQALEFFTAQDKDQLECAYALNNMSYAYMMQGQTDQSIQCAKDAYAFGSNPDDPTVEILSLANWGYAEFLGGDYDEALRLYQEVSKKGETLDFSPIGRAFYDNNSGEIMREMGKAPEALSLFEEAHAMFKSYKHLRGMAFTLNNIAGVHFMTGDYDKADALYEEAYTLYREIGDKPGIGHSLSALGNSAANRNKFADAKRFYEESLQIRREIGEQHSIADSLIDLAQIASAMDDPAEAQRLYEQALEIYKTTKNRAGEAYAISGFGLSLIFQNRADEAERWLKEGLALGESVKNFAAMGQSVAGLGAVYLTKGDLDSAREYFRKTMEFGIAAGYQGAVTYGLAGMASVIAERGDKARALELAFPCLKLPHGLITVTEKMAEDLIGRLSGELSPEIVRAAKENSQIATLEVVAQNVLSND